MFFLQKYYALPCVALVYFSIISKSKSAFRQKWNSWSMPCGMRCILSYPSSQSRSHSPPVFLLNPPPTTHPSIFSSFCLFIASFSCCSFKRNQVSRERKGGLQKMFIGFGWLVVDRILSVDWIGGRSEVLFFFFLHILCKCCWNLCVCLQKVLSGP